MLVIRALNDKLRIDCSGGYFVVTQGIHALGQDELAKIEKAIIAFDDFRFQNDPFGEHDFGKVRVSGRDIFWKIDYYDQTQTHHSPDPANSNVTTRVMTVMLASEY
ncbi:DUF3768 domain-containing protein [Erythrobacter arachoides]|uniref:DUF3768 domain-containing protein n=2 Tax=Aurantiacibacter arachoides TaxID=1850444 RepID=A0A844ZZK2_9SPHN|nr:DUF3768 domain-containing protein [Aurantiacibacter arachoides]